MSIAVLDFSFEVIELGLRSGGNTFQILFDFILLLNINSAKNKVIIVVCAGGRFIADHALAKVFKFFFSFPLFVKNIYFSVECKVMSVYSIVINLDNLIYIFMKILLDFAVSGLFQRTTYTNVTVA